MVSYHNLDMLRATSWVFRRRASGGTYEHRRGARQGTQRGANGTWWLQVLYLVCINLSVVSVACWLQVMSIAFRKGFCIFF